MSTYVLMKILESVPFRYDRGIGILTLGAVDRAYDRLVPEIGEGDRVLDIGCGTGALTIRAAERGAVVVGIDTNPGMIDTARKRAAQAGLSDRVEFREMGVAELGNEPGASYDVVMSGLCFSELSEDELRYAMEEAGRVLMPGGLLLVADEVKPAHVLKRIITLLIRVPFVLITSIVAGTTTRPVSGLPDRVRVAGFDVESVRLNRLENFMELSARNPLRGAR